MPSTSVVQRRQAITSSLALTASFCLQQFLRPDSAGAATATSTDIIPDDQVADAILGNSSVVPALTVDEYVQRINTARSPAFQGIAELIDNGKYKEVSEALFLSPFDDIMRCAFFMPWAMLRIDVNRAARCQDAYTAFLQAVKDFDRASISASRFQIEDEELLQQLSVVATTLDGLLAAAAYK